MLVGRGLAVVTRGDFHVVENSAPPNLFSFRVKMRRWDVCGWWNKHGTDTSCSSVELSLPQAVFKCFEIRGRMFSIPSQAETNNSTLLNWWKISTKFRVKWFGIYK